MSNVGSLRPRYVLVAAACIALSACARPSTTPPVVRIVATDSGYIMPERIPSGLTEFRMVNAGHSTHEGMMAHFLTPDATAAHYADSVRADVDFPAFAEDFGGPGLAEPGDSTTTWMDLAPGKYAIMCWAGNHISHDNQVTDFEVVPATSHAVPPTADVRVRMMNFGYQVDGTWTAGTHVVYAENIGPEPHEFDSYKMLPGKSVEDVLRWIDADRRGPPAAVAVGGSGDFVTGRHVWFVAHLTPGRYIALCQVPARADRKPHYKHGMHMEFEVK